MVMSISTAEMHQPTTYALREDKADGRKAYTRAEPDWTNTAKRPAVITYGAESNER